MADVATLRLALRVALAVATVGFALVYLFVMFVAFVTSGPPVFLQLGGLYAASVPLLYVGVAGAWAFRRIALPSTSTLIVLHIVAAPMLVFSFLGLGLLLPVLALLWWGAARGGEPAEVRVPTSGALR